jgi:hypothetical protein
MLCGRATAQCAISLRCNICIVRIKNLFSCTTRTVTFSITIFDKSIEACTFLTFISADAHVRTDYCFQTFLSGLDIKHVYTTLKEILSIFVITYGTIII